MIRRELRLFLLSWAVVLVFSGCVSAVLVLTLPVRGAWQGFGLGAGAAAVVGAIGGRWPRLHL